MSSASSSQKRWLVAVVALVVLGSAFRIQQFFGAREFSNDECSLLMNIAGKSARQLLGPLDRSQAAPPVFLEILRACYVQLGDSELSLRLWPMVSGVIAIGLFAALAWRWLPPAQAVIVTGLFAFSDTLVWHTVEVKQYSSDVLMCVLLLWMATGLRTLSVTARLWIIAAFAAAAVWLSHPVVFVFAGVGLACMPVVFKERRGQLHFMAANALVGISFVLLYLLSIRVQKTDALTHMWDLWFVPWSQPLQIPIWFVKQVLAIADYPVQGPGGVILTVLATWGAVTMVRHRQITVLWLLTPIALPLLASMVRAYPFTGGRVTLYLTPIVLLLAGAGMHAWQESQVPFMRRTWWILPAFLLGWVSVEAAYHVYRLEEPGPLRPALVYLRQHRRADDGVYVVGRNTLAKFTWYWRNESAPWVFKKEVDSPNVPIPFDHYWLIAMFHPKRDRGIIAQDLAWASQNAMETERLMHDDCVAARFERIADRR